MKYKILVQVIHFIDMPPKSLTIKDMKELAKKRGGKCLSKKYVNAHTKLLWQCKKKHCWYAVPDGMKRRNKWCPYCAGNARQTIEDMRRLAKSRGGKCLSKEYLGNHKKLLWKCKEGHLWKAIPNNIVRGSWCPKCANNAKRISSTLKQRLS